MDGSLWNLEARSTSQNMFYATQTIFFITFYFVAGCIMLLREAREYAVPVKVLT